MNAIQKFDLKVMVGFLAALILVVGSLSFVAVRLTGPSPVHAQSGTTCCKIDPYVWSVDDQGNITVYKVPSGGLTLPTGTTTAYTGTSLADSLKAVEDAAYKAKGTQQSRLEKELPLIADGPEPIPLCWPWPSCSK